MTMMAAIYARKSTEQKVSKDALSVTQQEEGARAFALAKGWTVTHVFAEPKEISGAEFGNRPGFRRLMDSLHPKLTPAFTWQAMSQAVASSATGIGMFSSARTATVVLCVRTSSV